MRHSVGISRLVFPRLPSCLLHLFQQAQQSASSTDVRRKQRHGVCGLQTTRTAWELLHTGRDLQTACAGLATPGQKRPAPRPLAHAPGIDESDAGFLFRGNFVGSGLQACLQLASCLGAAGSQGQGQEEGQGRARSHVARCGARNAWTGEWRDGGGGQTSAAAPARCARPDRKGALKVRRDSAVCLPSTTRCISIGTRCVLTAPFPAPQAMQAGTHEALIRRRLAPKKGPLPSGGRPPPWICLPLAVGI